VNSQYWETDIKERLSEKVISYFIGKYVKLRYRMWMLRKEANESRLHQEDLSRICLQHVFPVTSPLALISQIRGSGGSLLNQLFDGHPELHTHPYEFVIGIHHWPKIDVNDHPENWFEILFEDIDTKFSKEGYEKGKEEETFPFVFIPALQRKIFLDYMDSVQSITVRDIFNGYLTSYFGSWLNNQNYNGQKKFITALSPRLGLIKENLELFFETYPDGRLISPIRDPKTWLPFAGSHWPETYEDAGTALNQWNEFAQAMLWNKEKYGDSVCLIKFEDLASKTVSVMHYLADFLGIAFDDILLVPTFNKLPVRVSRSFKGENHGILNGTVSSDRALTAEESATIEEMTRETYQLVLKDVVRIE
jgi:hypothetical protein